MRASCQGLREWVAQFEAATVFTDFGHRETEWPTAIVNRVKDLVPVIAPLLASAFLAALGAGIRRIHPLEARRRVIMRDFALTASAAPELQSTAFAEADRLYVEHMKIDASRATIPTAASSQFLGNVLAVLAVLLLAVAALFAGLEVRDGSDWKVTELLMRIGLGAYVLALCAYLNALRIDWQERKKATPS